VTLYLQAGCAADLVEKLGDIPTVIVNGYYGERLGAGVLSRRERREMEELMRAMDRIVRL
jgi:hypothetical protein